MSQTSSLLATALLSVTLGYWIGVGNSLSFQRADAHSESKDDSPSQEKDISPENTEDAAQAETDEGSESGSEEEEEDDGPIEGLDTVQAGFMEECKLVLVVRTDLKMTKGKIAAQCGHATLACYKTLLASNPALLHHWERTGQAKIALQVASEDELLLLQATAQSLNVCARDICDAGRTQIAAGSRTVLGVGPAPVRLVNQITGQLKLL